MHAERVKESAGKRERPKKAAEISRPACARGAYIEGTVQAGLIGATNPVLSIKSGVYTRKYPGNFFKSTREREEALVECRQRDLEDRYQDLILVVVCYTAQDGKYP